MEEFVSPCNWESGVQKPGWVRATVNPVKADSIIPLVLCCRHLSLETEDVPVEPEMGVYRNLLLFREEKTTNRHQHKKPARTRPTYRDGGFASIFPVLQQQGLHHLLLGNDLHWSR